MTYFSWAALSSWTTRSYFLLVFSTLFFTKVALPVFGTDLMKTSHSWIFLVFSGSMRRTSLVMFCSRNRAFEQLNLRPWWLQDRAAGPWLSSVRGGDRAEGLCLTAGASQPCRGQRGGGFW